MIFITNVIATRLGVTNLVIFSRGGQPRATGSEKKPMEVVFPRCMRHLRGGVGCRRRGEVQTRARKICPTCGIPARRSAGALPELLER